jgi:hypothetical protein
VLTIAEMLRTYRDAQEVLTTTEGGGDGAPWMMPRAWNQSYRQLETLLHRMSRERPKKFFHVRSRYLDSNRRQCELVFRAGRYVGLNAFEAVLKGFAGPYDPLFPPVRANDREARGMPSGWCVVDAWRPEVRRQEVKLGVMWLAQEFVGEPYLFVDKESDSALEKAQKAA